MTDNELTETHNMPTLGLDRISRPLYSSACDMARIIRRTYPDLTTYLEETGTTQVELAKRLGKSQAFISKLVNGITQPSLDEALRISRLVGVPVESLVSRTGNIPVEQ